MVAGSEGSSLIATNAYTRRLVARIQDLEAENTLMNELVKDLKERNESMEKQVNRLVKALIVKGVSVTEAVNTANG